MHFSFEGFFEAVNLLVMRAGKVPYTLTPVFYNKIILRLVRLVNILNTFEHKPVLNTAEHHAEYVKMACCNSVYAVLCRLIYCVEHSLT